MSDPAEILSFSIAKLACCGSCFALRPLSHLYMLMSECARFVIIRYIMPLRHKLGIGMLF